jgi:hypothetical protein
MRLLIPLSAMLLLAVNPAAADEPPPIEVAKAVADRAKPLRDRWEQCAAAAVRADLPSKTPAEDLAEQALTRCKPRETALGQFLTRQVGREQASRVTASVRRMLRINLILVINAFRNG